MPGFAEPGRRVSFVRDETRAETTQLILGPGRAARGDGWLEEHQPAVQWWGWNAEPRCQEPADPRVKMGLDKVEAVTNEKTTPVGSPASLYNRFSSYFGFPPFCLGPRGEKIHGYDECIYPTPLIDMTKMIALPTLDWCGRNGRLAFSFQDTHGDTMPKEDTDPFQSKSRPEP